MNADNPASVKPELTRTITLNGESRWKIWVGPDQGDWSDPDNWSPRGVPSDIDSTFIRCRFVNEAGETVAQLGSDGAPSNETRPTDA